MTKPKTHFCSFLNKTHVGSQVTMKIMYNKKDYFAMLVSLTISVQSFLKSTILNFKDLI